jgi:hypothetical protein
MNRNTAFYTRLLLNRHSPQEIEEVLSRFPAGKEALEEGGSEAKPIEALFVPPSEILEKVHYSWIAALLKQEAGDKVTLYLAALPAEKREKVKALLSINEPTPELDEPFKTFVQKTFAERLIEENYLPLLFLPKSPLAALTQLDKDKLITVIDYLGLIDLSEAMKKIVDTKTLKRLTDTLSPRQKAFLKQCMLKKDKVQGAPFTLTDWNGEKRELFQKIHKRGLVRFAKALSGEDPRLVWHLLHTLDTGRADAIASLLSGDTPPQITESMISKILQILAYLEKESPL